MQSMAYSVVVNLFEETDGTNASQKGDHNVYWLALLTECLCSKLSKLVHDNKIVSMRNLYRLHTFTFAHSRWNKSLQRKLTSELSTYGKSD